MEATARVIRWSNRQSPAPVKEPAQASVASVVERSEFGAIEEFIVMIPDEQLEALGAIFASSPLRRAMTFEGYLIAKGFGQPLG
jgi:hypothetical protein